MLIDSPYRDYYDSIQAFGIDKTVVYKRTELKVADKPYLERLYASIGRLSWLPYVSLVEITYGLIGFCGALYPYIKVTKRDIGYKVEEVKVYWGRKEFEEGLEKMGDGRKVKDFREAALRVVKDKDFFNPVTWVSANRVFLDYKVPVFNLTLNSRLGTGIDLVLNPRLTPIRFVTVKGPPTAFQDIYSYLSGVLGTQPDPMPKMADKVMQYAKGFDHPYSFRKEPTKRKHKK